MPWSGGGVSFSGGPNTYSVSYSEPTYNDPPAGYFISAGPYVKSAGPSSVSCGSSASQTYEVELTRTSPLSVIYSSTTVSGTAPACVTPPPTYPPAWSDNFLEAFTVGQAYSNGVTATNMNYSGSYSVTSGSLPTGISLNSSTGAVTGTPTSASDYSFTIRAQNSYGSVSQAFSGTISGGLRTFNGSTWVKAPVAVFNGSTWVTGTVYVYNGSSWVKSV